MDNDFEEYDDTSFDMFPYPEEKEFIEAVAQDCIANMNDEIRAFLMDPANESLHHFGFGLYIRNTYIHVRKDGMPPLPGPVSADALSGVILDRIIEILRED